MDKFNKYFNDQYFCDFSKSSMQEEPFTLEKLRTAESTLRNKQQEQELYNLFQFIKIWRDKYDLFCHEFNCYTITKSSIPVWSGSNNQYGFDTVIKSEFYVDQFFYTLLDKRFKFEIQEHEYRRGMDYDYLEPNYFKRNLYGTPNTTKVIYGDKFIMSWQDNNYRLDIKLNSALICSLLVAISNNFTVYDWYSKKSRFKEFIDKMSNDFKYLTFEFNKSHSRIKLCGRQEMIIDIDTRRGWFYFIFGDEVVRVENKLYYAHLDKIFGSDRTKPLTEEDIQLYSILNESRKPLMYDFEF